MANASSHAATTSLVKLRDFRLEDVAVLRGIRNDTELQRQLMAIPTPNSDDDVVAWVHRRKSEGDTYFAVVSDAASDQPVGFVQLKDIADRMGTLGIAIARSNQGKGFGNAALVGLLHIARTELSLVTVRLTVLSTNDAAIALYKQCGFTDCPVKAGPWTDADGATHDVTTMHIDFSDSTLEAK